MADTARNFGLVSPEDYLRLERESSHRQEFVNGVIYAMSGGTERHNLIAGDIYVALTNHLPVRCRPFIADMKLRIKLASAEFYYYPDTMVCCGPWDQSRDWRDHPLVVGEVLSPSTERTDRSEKLPAYIEIPTVQEVLLIQQDTVQVELFPRSNNWEREVLKAGDTLRLPSIDFAVGVDALYRRVEF
jgi:Uma2 family endonuclease